MALSKQEADFVKKIGRNIRAIREKKGITQKQLADLCDFEKPTMSRIESGGTNITAKTLLKVAKALGVTVAEMVKV
jgi:transcriptional regulator with XRE-family HTH domain